METNNEYLGFVDDDNWAAENWVAKAYQGIASGSRLVAVGSVLMPARQLPSPAWFDNCHSSYGG